MARKLTVIPLDSEDFRQWLGAQGPIVGTARKEPDQHKWVPFVGLAEALTRPIARDESPLARYVSEQLGQRVRLYYHAVSYQRSTPIGTLPEWAWAFDKLVQANPGQVVTKDEALAALRQVNS